MVTWLSTKQCNQIVLGYPLVIHLLGKVYIIFLNDTINNLYYPIPDRPEIKGPLLNEPFSGVHAKVSADAEALLRLGSHLEKPRGWRNSFSIQRTSERNVGECAIDPYFRRP